MTLAVTAAIIGGGAALGGALISSNAAKSAASEQANAANRASDLQYQMWQEQQALQKPWLQAGETALNKLTPLATNYTPFGMQQFQQDPGYAFRVSEGLKAVDRQAAARGGLISGAALKASQRYGQEMASQEYQNAFNRYQAERQAQLGPLQSLAGVGQTTAQTLGGQAGQYASNVGELGMQAANARASGYVGQANALSGALTGAANTYQQNQILNRLLGSGGNTAGSYSATDWGTSQWDNPVGQGYGS